MVTATVIKPFSFRSLTFRAKLTYIAHAFKAVVKLHHAWMDKLLRQFIDANSVIFDIGGHSGQYAKLFARLASQGRVYTFEPGTYQRSILLHSMRLNRHHNVEVVDKGLSSRPGYLSLITPLKKSGIFRIGLSHLSTKTENPQFFSEDVNVTTIDIFAKEIELKKLDFIKIDVEGWETQILKGGAETILRFHPTILLELDAKSLNRAGDDLEKTWAMLLEWGYKPYIFADEKSLVSHLDPREGDTIWLHYFEDGQIWSKGTYKDGKRISSEVLYDKDGKLNGPRVGYSENGK